MIESANFPFIVSSLRLSGSSTTQESKLTENDKRGETIFPGLPHTHDVRTVAFSPDSQTLASAGRDKLIRLWSVPEGTTLGTRGGSGSVIRAIKFLSSDRIVEGNVDGDVVVWSPDNSSERVQSSTDEVHCLAVSPVAIKRPHVASRTIEKPEVTNVAAGDVLVSGRKFGSIKLMELSTRSTWMEPILPGVDIRTVAFAPDGRTLAAAGDDRKVHLWHVATGEELLTFSELPAPVNQIAFSPKGDCLATALHDGTIPLWHAPVAKSR